MDTTDKCLKETTEYSAEDDAKAINFDPKESVMKKRGWLIPVMILTLNALAIAVRWSHLPEPLLAHFDLQGNAAGTMSRNLLLIYPLISAVICLVAYMIGRIKHLLQRGLIILVSGFCLILLSSTMVSLTYGKIPFFMLAEPVILLSSVVAFIVSVLKSRKAK